MNVTVTRNRRPVRQRPMSSVDFESKYDEKEEETEEEIEEQIQVKSEASEPVSLPPPEPSRSLSDAIDRLTETLNRININPALISRDRDKNKKKQQRPFAPKYSMGPFYTEKEATLYNNPANRVDVTDKQIQ